jgi:hypothetical protein
MSMQSSKARSLRIRLDYFKHRGWLYWLRWACAAMGFVIAGGYGLFVIAGVFFVSENDAQDQSAWRAAAMQISTGKISKAHSHFESDCQKCHMGNALLAIASDAFKLDQQASLSGLAEKCQSCHQVQSHVARLNDVGCRAIDQNCASCHQEHNGFDTDLVNVASSKCTQCHANLSDVCDVTKLEIAQNVGSFAKGHAKFPSLDKDRGRIKFSHAQHLNPGQIKAGERGGFQVSMLPEKFKPVNADPNSLVELNCSDCHKLRTPSGELAFEKVMRSGSATDAEFSQLFAPIRFDEHCVACHQFTFAGQSTEMLPLPHAAARQEFETLLSSRLVGGKLSGRIAMRQDQAHAAEALQNESIAKPHATAALTELVNVEVAAAVARLAAGCAKCHEDENLMDAKPAERQSAKPMIPQRWLQRGFFDHGSHPPKLWRDVSPESPIQEFCFKCHDVSSDESSSTSRRVMIKGPESCTPCHNLSEYSASLQNDRANSNTHRSQLVASDACVLCHRYHWSRQGELP